MGDCDGQPQLIPRQPPHSSLERPQHSDSSLQCREMVEFPKSDQESGVSSPPPLDTSAMLAALARDVVATREDVAALRVNLTRLSEEVRAAQERVAPNRHRAAREVLVSTTKHLERRA